MTVNDVVAWDIPESDICSAALRLVTEVSPAFLTNHCIRLLRSDRGIGLG
jgi:hypothetical protein